jgi:hypothetical protein
MDNGARWALVLIENKRHFLKVPGDIMEHVGSVFHGSLAAPAQKALGL